MKLHTFGDNVGTAGGPGEPVSWIVNASSIDGKVHICLSEEKMSIINYAGIHMTPAEARELARKLIQHADGIEL